MEKWPILDRNHRLTPLKKSRFFDFLNFLFLEPKKAFCRFRIPWNTLFWPILPKIKRWKNGEFRTKTMDFGKISILRLFELLVFVASNIFQPIFLASIGIKRWKNGQFWDHHQGQIPFEKSQFFDFLNFLFSYLRKAFYSFSIIVKHIFLAYIA